MKILHIVEPLATGIYSFLLDLTDRQCKHNDVYIAYGIRPETPVNFKSEFNSSVNWIKIEHFQRSIGKADIKAYSEIRHIIKTLRPDIIHLHSSKAGFLGRWAYNCRKYKVFYNPHGFSFLMSDSHLKSFFYRFIEYISAFRGATTIACSKGEYEEAKKLPGQKTYINNGINVNDLNSFLHDNFKEKPKPVICTSGRISYQKNPELFNRIANLLPDYKFIWIGEGDLSSKLTSPNIEITGWLPREKSLEIISNSDIFMLASLWEGLPISLLEAMYLKKLCIVSDVIGNRDVIINEGNGFVCSSADDFVRVIESVFSTRSEMQRICVNAHNDVLNNYNADLMAGKYNEIYFK